MLPAELIRLIERAGGVLSHEVGDHRRYDLYGFDRDGIEVVVQIPVRQQPSDEDVPPCLVAAVMRDLALVTGRQRASRSSGLGRGHRNTSPPGQMKFRIVNWVVAVLPPEVRPRYHEELHAELLELAMEGETARAQLVYSCRLLVRALSLRRSLSASGPAPGRSF